MHYLWACGYTASFSRFSWVQTSRRIQSTSNYMQCLYIFFSSLYCDVVRRRPLSICMPLQNACTNIQIHSIFFSLSFAYSLHYTYLRVCQHTRVKQLKLNGDHRTTTSSNKTMLLYCLQCAPVGRTQSIQIRHRHWTAKTQILRCSMEFYGTRPSSRYRHVVFKLFPRYATLNSRKKCRSNQIWVIIIILGCFELARWYHRDIVWKWVGHSIE